jgi:hypothetical protein
MTAEEQGTKQMQRGSQMSYFENLNTQNMLNALNPNNVLHAVGLRRESEARVLTDTVLPALAVFSAGILVGAAVALLVTPKTGRELRNDLQRKAGQITDNVKERIPALRNDGEPAMTSSYAARSTTDL